MKKRALPLLVLAAFLLILAGGCGITSEEPATWSESPSSAPSAAAEAAVPTQTSVPSAAPDVSKAPVAAVSAAQTQQPDSQEAAQTDSPAPSDSAAQTTGEETALTCTLWIRCDTILDHMDMLDEAEAELVPEDGVLLHREAVPFTEGESVFDLLLRVTREEKLHLEFVDTPLYHSAYIEGIGNLYEFDCGELSGWSYKVNGIFPGVGCSLCKLADGDVVEWVYTCDMGQDVGGSNGWGDGS